MRPAIRCAEPLSGDRNLVRRSSGTAPARPTIAGTVSLSGGSASTGHQRRSSDSSLITGTRAGRGAHEVAHVQVPGRDAERAGHRVDVDVQRLRRDLQAGDPRLLGGLAQRRGAQRGVARLAVAAELDPPADARVQGQQHVLARGVEHERRGGEVAGHAGAVAGVGGAGVEEGQQRVLQRPLGLVAAAPTRRSSAAATAGAHHGRSTPHAAHAGAGRPRARGSPRRVARRARRQRLRRHADGDRAERLPVGREVQHRAHDVRGEDRGTHPARPEALGGERHQQRLHRGTPRDGEHRALVRAPSLVRDSRASRRRCGTAAPAPARGAAGRRGASGGRPRPAGRPSPSRSARHRSAIASSRAARFARTHTNRNGVLWCGAGAVRATPTARRSAAGSTGASAKSRTLRRSSTASRRPVASASSVPRKNRSSSSGRMRSRAAEPSSTGAAPRTTATGTPPSLPLTRSAAAASSSASATSVTCSSFPSTSIAPP